MKKPLIGNNSSMRPSHLYHQTQPSPKAPTIAAILGGIFLCWLNISSTALAQAGDRLALVIGNSDYSNLRPLTNPRNDAIDMAAKLEDLGFQVTHEENLGLKDMKRSMVKFRQQISDKTEVALIYYAGHGAEANGVGYLLPVDIEFNREDYASFTETSIEDMISAEAIHIEYFLDQLTSKQSAAINILILDACRDMGVFRGGGTMPAKEYDDYQHTWIAYSTKSGSQASDGLGLTNSPYTNALLQQLDQPGLSLFDIFNNTAITMKKSTGQQPWLSAGLGAKNIVLRPEKEEPLTPTESHHNIALATSEAALSAAEQAAIEAADAALEAARAAAEQAAIATAAPITPMPQPIIDESIWMDAIWQWADEFQISHETIPRDPERLKSLSSLALCNYDTCQRADLPKITYLPPEIGQLRSLQALDLTNNQLTMLPPEVSLLNNLEKLDLAANELSEFPNEIAQLRQLQRLDLSFNKLTSLSSDIGKLSQLKELYLSFNKLTYLPPNFTQLNQLQKIDLMYRSYSHDVPPEITQMSKAEKIAIFGDEYFGTSTPPKINFFITPEEFEDHSGLHSRDNPKLGLYINQNQQAFIKAITDTK